MADYATVVRPLYDMPYGNTKMGLAVDNALGTHGALRWGNKETQDALDAVRVGGTPEQIATLIVANRRQGNYDTIIGR